jgi:hypothetical protein
MELIWIVGLKGLKLCTELPGLPPLPVQSFKGFYLVQTGSDRVGVFLKELKKQIKNSKNM